MRKACCVCHRNVSGNPLDKDVSHGYCPSCKGWHHEWNQRLMMGKATQEQFDEALRERRINMNPVKFNICLV